MHYVYIVRENCDQVIPGCNQVQPRPLISILPHINKFEISPSENIFSKKSSLKKMSIDEVDFRIEIDSIDLPALDQ